MSYGAIHPHDLYDLLSKHANVLERVREGDDATDLRRETDMADSTVYKALRELREAGLVRKTNGAYELTAYGKAVCEKHEEISRIREARPVFEHMGDEVDIAVLADFDVVFSETHAPEKPVSRMEAVVDSSETVRGLAPVVTERYVRFARQKAVEGLEAEFVLESDVFEHIRSEYPRMLEEQLQNVVSLYVTERLPPYGLLVSDAGVCVIPYDDGGIAGGLFSDSASAREWGENVYREYRQDATRVRREAVESDIVGQNSNIRKT
jgi:predicted transcriptional regulator